MSTAATSEHPVDPAGTGRPLRRFGLLRLWRNKTVRSLLYQGLVLAAVIGTAAYMIGNAQEAMHRRGIATGFGFLFQAAGFAIGESLTRFASSDTILQAYVAAILNTLKVSVLGIAAATMLGVLVGVARLSSNWLLSKLASAYVELFRNTPQLVQIIFWYALVTRLPRPRQAWSLGDWCYLSNRGIVMAWPAADPVYWIMAVALLAAGALAYLIARWAERYRRQTGRVVRVAWWNLSLIIALPALVWLAGGMPSDWNMPQLRGFSFVGGVAISPEFLALLLGLSLYIAAFIAEIVRSGIQSVGRGQREAARAIGLGRFDLYRRVLLPQALRVIVLPAAGQYVSLAKNSSLGVAIGYPELFNVSNTIITATGNTIECIVIMMAVYLTISFAIAAVMNLCNRAVRLAER